MHRHAGALIPAGRVERAGLPGKKIPTGPARLDRPLKEPYAALAVAVVLLIAVTARFVSLLLVAFS